jgi:hypothetical protein
MKAVTDAPAGWLTVQETVPDAALAVNEAMEDAASPEVVMRIEQGGPSQVYANAAGAHWYKTGEVIVDRALTNPGRRATQAILTERMLTIVEWGGLVMGVGLE